MQTFHRGTYEARLAVSGNEVHAACQLRARAFGLQTAVDRDAFDTDCQHVLISDRRTDALVACFRLLRFDGRKIQTSYCAQFYDLSLLEHHPGCMAEIGRFCVDPDLSDPDILRVAWAALTRLVDDHQIEFLFGCASFPGTDADPYRDAFALLQDMYLGPKHWLPRVKSPQVVRFDATSRLSPNKKRALQNIPSLLRTYLMMGGWVSDHAVIDPHMNTLHVFTGLEVAHIPAVRKRLLRAVSR